MKKNKTKLAFSLIELSIVILIIGVLVLGISRGSRIISASRLTSAKALTANSPVNLNADNLALWYETTSDNSLISMERVNGGSVSTWKDIKPSAATDSFDASAPGAQPTYMSNATNGLPALKFNNTILTKNNVAGNKLTIDGNQITIFVVQKFYTPIITNFFTPIMWQSAPNRLGMHTTNESGVIYFDFGVCCGGDARVSFGAPTTFFDKTIIVTATRKPNNIMAVRINGSDAITPQSGKTSILNPALTATFIVGNDGAKGEINEIIIFKNALKDAEILAIEKYLGTKWGIRLN